LRRGGRLGRVGRRRRPVLQFRMDGKRLANYQTIPCAGSSGALPEFSSRKRAPDGQSAWSSHGQSRRRERPLGRRSKTKKTASMETSRRHQTGNSVRSFHRHSGLFEQLLDKVQLELAAGYRRIKLKVKPGWDLKIIER